MAKIDSKRRSRRCPIDDEGRVGVGAAWKIGEKRGALSLTEPVRIFLGEAVEQHVIRAPA
ncbi:hypothetical protein G3O00_28405 [Burkholderia sp. Ac-20384]|uniref:hypothetical protein n=1 Tax=Burkholderia sp. Ac-20384 TaxID=2703902 RepID=UPI00198114CC|nr:hypothetical protein [Burkholderia sp. Ac-20384]MBN3827518.1 hypothetical protein [Burkholderia sp. Ac-20384]